MRKARRARRSGPPVKRTRKPARRLFDLDVDDDDLVTGEAGAEEKGEGK